MAKLYQQVLDTFFPPHPRSVTLAYAPIIALSFTAWYLLFRWIHRPLQRYSRWYRSLSEYDQRFVRAYVTRSLWAVQAVYTAYRVLSGSRDPVVAAERQDRVHGWSRFNDFAYPLTLGFALLENYVEIVLNFGEYWAARRDHRVTRTYEEQVPVLDHADHFSPLLTKEPPPSPPPSYNPSLLIHHVLFFLVEFHTFRTRSIVYFCNLLKVWEVTAPVSFLVWISQRRTQWRERRRNAVAKDDDVCISTPQKTKPLPTPPQTPPQTPPRTSIMPSSKRRWLPFLIGSRETARRLILFRIVVWFCCRTLYDVFIITSLYQEGLFPGGRNAGRLNFGNKIQLWVAAPFFWFGLNPLWLYGGIKSYLRVAPKNRRKEDGNLHGGEGVRRKEE